jgi:hypothetical protein
MAAGKGMPPEIRTLLKKIGIVGVEEEAQKLYPEAVELDADDEHSPCVKAADPRACAV